MAWAFERSGEGLYEQLAEYRPLIEYHLEREDRRRCPHCKSSKLIEGPPAHSRNCRETSWRLSASGNHR